MAPGGFQSGSRLDGNVRLVIVDSPDLAAPLVGALDAADLGAWMWVDAENTLYVSPRVLALLGLTRADDRPISRFLESVHADDRPAVRVLIDRHAPAGAFALRYRFLRSGGQHRWIDMRGRVEHDSAGALVRQGGTLQDVSADVEQREERAETSERAIRFDTLLAEVTAELASQPADRLDDALSRALERVGRFLGASAATLSEVSDDHWISLTHWWIDPAEVGRTRPIATELDGGPMGDILNRLAANQSVIVRTPEDLPAGSSARAFMAARKLHSLVGVPVRQPDGTLVVLAVAAADGGRADWPSDTVALLRMASDLLAGVLARVQADASQRLVERRIQETHRLESLGVLAGGIAHDFNNLLTAILGNANLIRAEYRELDTADGPLEQIESASRRAAELCRQMLAYAGRSRFAVQTININDVVRDSHTLLRVTVPTRSVLDISLAPDLPPVLADPVQLRQVLMNLVLNAVEAIGDREGTISIATFMTRSTVQELARATFSPEPADGEYVCLSVRDTGEGMTPDMVSRIFDPFFSTRFTGRGLGLAAVLGIVRAHKGALQVSSEPGAGSTFELFLPAHAAEPALPIEEAATAPFTTLNRWKSSGTVLVIDDELGVRHLVRQVLQRSGLTVVLAESGPKGIEVFRAIAPDVRLVLVDSTMPGMDGRATLDAIRRIRPDVRALLMSGYTYEGDANNSSESFLQKPFTPSTLRTVVRKLLGEDQTH